MGQIHVVDHEMWGFHRLAIRPCQPVKLVVHKQEDAQAYLDDLVEEGHQLFVYWNSEEGRKRLESLLPGVTKQTLGAGVPKHLRVAYGSNMPPVRYGDWVVVIHPGPVVYDIYVS